MEPLVGLVEYPGGVGGHVPPPGLRAMLGPLIRVITAVQQNLGCESNADTARTRRAIGQESMALSGREFTDRTDGVTFRSL
jgi:hypothetical protein